MVSRSQTLSQFGVFTCSLISASFSVVGGCGESKDPVAEGFDDEASADGTGETGEPLPDVGTGLLDPGECIADPRPGVWGYKHQCNGAFLARIGGTYDSDPFYFYIPSATSTGFGDGEEPYQQAKVIACCGEFDDELTLSGQPQYGENCLLDFRQQACMSLAVGLQTLIEDGTIPLAYKAKAIEVQNWIAENTGDCIDGFVDTNASPNGLAAVWELPSGAWEPTIEDAYVEIVFAQISGVHLPSTGAEVCESLHGNNGEVFTDQSATPFATTYDVELDDAEGDLVGPIYGGSRITASYDFASLLTSCSDPYCSTASFSVDSMGDWAIDRMVLYADGPFVVSNGTLDETIDSGRLELYRQALGSVAVIGGITHYTINAGDAQFMVIGESGEVATLPVVNSTDMKATLTSGVWSFDPFEFEYVDDNSDTWTLTVSSSEWL